MKYWGKRDAALNLPAVGSLSLTLAGLTATATVGAADSRAERFTSRGDAVGGQAARQMGEYLDLVARELGSPERLATDVSVDFPVAAGLASSAAIYCAVAAATASWAGRAVSKTELSVLARRGSGSASRSVFGGIVEWHRGERGDGLDSVAEPVLSEGEWDLSVAVAVVAEGPKAVSSRDGMEHVVRSSPLFRGWIEAQPADLEGAREAVAARDLERLGSISEANCLRMHATALAARPAVIYWVPATLAVIAEVYALRRAGVGAYFTIDAGPQVKVLCSSSDLPGVRKHLEQVPGVVRVLESALGPGVEIVDGAIPWRS